MQQSARMLLGVVVERRRSRSPWQDWSWRPVSVILGAPPLDAGWRELVREPGLDAYHAANLPLELTAARPRPTSSISARRRRGSTSCCARPAHSPQPWRPLLITASPVEAEGYLASGEEIVEGVPMPAPVVAWLEDFVARHHVEQPFVKRKRRRGARAPPRAGGRPRRRASADRREHG